MRLAKPGARFSDDTLPEPRPAPISGLHSRDALIDFGLPAAVADALSASGVLVQAQA
jgi:hypothetical protein